MDQVSGQPTARPRAVLYSRLSRATIASTSMEGQREDLHSLAEREGWDVVAAFDDEGKSGGKKRANAEEALRMLRDNEVDVLAAYSVDRYSRMGIGEDAEVIRVVDAREALAARGLSLRPLAYFAREGIRSDSGPDWRLRFAVSSENARNERDTMVMRRKRSIQQLQDQGRFTGRGPAPWGYRAAPHPSGAGRTLILDLNEVTVIREAAERLIAAETATSVARDFTRRGVPTPRSDARLALLRGLPTDGLATGHWSIANIVQALQSPSITGRIVRMSKQPNGLGGESRTGTPVLDRDGQPLQAFPAALPLGDWLAIQQRFPRGVGRGRQAKRKAPRLGSGLVYCECGEKAYVISNGSEVRYRCSAKTRGMLTCPSPSMAADAVDQTIEDHFLGAFGSRTAREWVESLEAPEVTDAIARAADELRRLTSEMTQPGADVMSLAAKVAEVSARRDELLATPAQRTGRWRTLGGTWADIWEASDLDTRRRYLDAAYDHWELRPATSSPRLVPRVTPDYPTGD